AAAGPDGRWRPAPEVQEALTCRSPYGRTNQTQTSRVEEEPDLAHRRRRQALAARRPHDRDDRAVQPADRALDDGAPGGARAPLARARRPALGDGRDAVAHQGHPGLGQLTG